MKRARWIITVALAFALGGGSVHALTAWTRTTPYIARVHCTHAAEDSLAHLRLTDYTRNADGTLTLRYRCRTRGY